MGMPRSVSQLLRIGVGVCPPPGALIENQLMPKLAADALPWFALPLLGALAGVAPGCAQNFHEARTPSGQYCSDMPVYFNNQPDPDRPFHRIKPIATPIKSLTAPERLEALRVEACKLGGDAVIGAGDEEAQAPDHTVIMRASGYAVRWTNAQPKTPVSRQTIGGTAPPPMAGPAPSPAPGPAAPRPPMK
jgi:hypothetical protein